MEQLFEFDCSELEKPIEPIPDAVLWCFERRIAGLRGSFAAHLKIKRHVPILIPGGVKRIVMPRVPRDAESLMELIEVAHEKLGAIRLYAMAHLYCADCEGSSDQGYYEVLLQDAEAILTKRFPLLEVIPVFVDCKGVKRL